jgi:hypothetical protein
MGIMDRILGRRSTKARYLPAPPARIAGLMAVMTTDREDGEDLCERLLDLAASRIGGRPRRHAVDSRSWYAFRRVDPSRDPFSGIEELERDHRPHGWSQRFATLLEWMVDGSGVEVDESGLEAESFYYDHQPGSAFIVWQDEPPEAENALVCRGCGSVYDFAKGVGMITDEDSVADFLSAGLEVCAHPHRIEYPCPDLVVAETDVEEVRGLRDHVIRALSDGRYRRWRCERCHRVQGYPGSLLLKA